jgi:hypothetical protein
MARKEYIICRKFKKTSASILHQVIIRTTSKTHHIDKKYAYICSIG